MADLGDAPPKKRKPSVAFVESVIPDEKKTADNDVVSDSSPSSPTESMVTRVKRRLSLVLSGPSLRVDPGGDDLQPRRQSTLFAAVGRTKSAYKSRRKVASLANLPQRRASEYVTQEVATLTSFVMQACEGIELGTFSLIDNYEPMPMGFDSLIIPSDLQPLVDILCQQTNEELRLRKIKAGMHHGHKGLLSSLEGAVENIEHSVQKALRSKRIGVAKQSTKKKDIPDGGITDDGEHQPIKYRQDVTTTCTDILKFFLGAGYYMKRAQDLDLDDKDAEWKVCPLVGINDFVELAALQSHERWAAKMKREGYVFGSTNEGKKEFRLVPFIALTDTDQDDLREVPRAVVSAFVSNEEYVLVKKTQGKEKMTKIAVSKLLGGIHAKRMGKMLRRLSTEKRTEKTNSSAHNKRIGDARKYSLRHGELIVSRQEDLGNASKMIRKATGKVRLKLQGKVDAAKMSVAIAEVNARSKSLINPQTPIMRVWDVVMVIALLYTSIWIPVELLNVECSRVTNAIADVLFFADVFVSFRLMIVLPRMIVLTGRYCTNARLIRSRYLRSWFAIDLISALPFELLQYEYITRRFSSRANALLRLFRLVQLTRLLRTSRIFSRWNDKMNINIRLMRSLKVCVFTMFACHWMACVWAFLPAVQTKDTVTWFSLWMDEFDTKIDCTARYRDASASGAIPITNGYFQKSCFSLYELYISSLHFSVMTVREAGLLVDCTALHCTM
jgi:hypothetical protein